MRHDVVAPSTVIDLRRASARSAARLTRAFQKSTSVVCFAHASCAVRWCPTSRLLRGTPCPACGEGRDSHPTLNPCQGRRHGGFHSSATCVRGGSCDPCGTWGCSAPARWQHGGPALLVSLTRFRDLTHGEPPRPQGSGGTSSWEAEPKHNMCGAALIPFLFWSECRQEGEWAQNWDGAQERSGGWLVTYTDRSEVTRQASRSLVLLPGML